MREPLRQHVNTIPFTSLVYAVRAPDIAILVRSGIWVEILRYLRLRLMAYLAGQYCNGRPGLMDARAN